jgi:hypothetical protein
LILLRGQKPLILSKITPEEFPVFEKLKSARITDYVPKWRETQDFGQENETADECAPEKAAVRSNVNEPPIQLKFEDFPDAETRVRSDEIEEDTNGADSARVSWYPKTEYSLSEDGDAETAPENPVIRNNAAVNKYGALKPVEITPEDIKNTGIALQNGREE